MFCSLEGRALESADFAHFANESNRQIVNKLVFDLIPIWKAQTMSSLRRPITYVPLIVQTPHLAYTSCLHAICQVLQYAKYWHIGHIGAPGMWHDVMPFMANGVARHPMGHNQQACEE